MRFIYSNKLFLLLKKKYTADTGEKENKLTLRAKVKNAYIHEEMAAKTLFLSIFYYLYCFYCLRKKMFNVKNRNFHGEGGKQFCGNFVLLKTLIKCSKTLKRCCKTLKKCSKTLKKSSKTLKKMH